MGDEKDPSAQPGSTPETAPSVAPAAPISVVPRPVSVPPRPVSGAAPGLPSRMPPPPSSRGILPGMGASGARSSLPPPAPQRAPTSSPAPAGPVSAVAASPSVVPRAPATPPPPPQRHSSSPGFARPLTQPPVVSVTTQLEQRLGATQIELRKLASERHTLRARLRREADRLRELESALRAEKELRAQASDEHFASILGLRSRLVEVELERDAASAQSNAELQQARSELAQLRSQLEEARSALEQARAAPPDSGVAATPAAARPNKLVQGLRRIRGIGPAYQRVLEQAGISRVQQIASWTAADLHTFALKLKIKPERISKDDWVGQARALTPDPED